MTSDLFNILGYGVICFPALLLATLGISTLMHRSLSEQWIGRATAAGVIAGLSCAVAILTFMLWTDTRQVPIEVGDWIAIPHEHFQFHLKFVFDRLSVPFVILSFILVGTIGAFANRYLHRDPGYGRFFILYAVFLVGMVVASLAGSIETLFFGWELVGLSSALLVAYFHERTAPVLNGLRVWTVYRVADAAFLIAAVVLHHLTGTGDFSGLMGSGAWPLGEAALTSNQALLIGSLLLIAAAGKSALLPFSGWLPRAMEGPTPSSAVFYGALSVHLGVFLLLRVSPIIELSFALQAAIVMLGLASAIFGAMAARVQSDVKSALAFASLTQVGIIAVEIGLGFRYLALVHIIGHACLRTLQLLRAPSLLHDYHQLENAIGGHLPGAPEMSASQTRSRWYTAAYRLAFERGQLDDCLDRFIAQPFLGIFRRCDRYERWWTDRLSGGIFQRRTRTQPAQSPEDHL